MKFTELNLRPEILQAVTEMGYVDLTPIQEETFLPIMENRDILALAETGSGKTSACGIPLAQRIDPAVRAIQVLILVPTRELALQYVDELDLICHHAGISPFAIYGGFSMDIQKAKLAHGVHFLVATPGRLIDLIYQGEISFESLKTMVLDEADEMLRMGFIEDVQFITSCIVVEHQTLLFSATMPADIEALAAGCLREPLRVQLNLAQATPPNISHRFRLVTANERLTALKEYLRSEIPAQAIIFTNSKRNGELLYHKLKGMEQSIEYIHGGLEQSRRTSIFNRFKKRQIRLLIATDVAGRGLDFTHVTHILNYEFPGELENYVHRTGRTGRMGNVGIAISLVTARDLLALRRLFKEINIEPLWDGEIPDLKKATAGVSHGGRRPGGGQGGRRPGPVRRPLVPKKAAPKS
ncbi:MAG: hypothetical protein A2521_07835 [Deltaproteobacteria bacterium RIFOXYD12_FULL_57_12]|nr:MAG: hypothetical protein A2521_07835 [Deltaproteobacteria bacterium RIFOXYD12_FULL_57_12]